MKYSKSDNLLSSKQFYIDSLLIKSFHLKMFRLLVNLITVNQAYLHTICLKLVKDLIPAESPDNKMTAEMVGDTAERLAIRIVQISPIAQTHLFMVIFILHRTVILL